MKNILKVLGRVGKGAVSLIGAALGLGGVGAAVASGNEQIAACVTTVLSQPEGVVTMVGVVLLLFGVGRKAGFIAGKEPPTP